MRTLTCLTKLKKNMLRKKYIKGMKENILLCFERVRGATITPNLYVYFVDFLRDFLSVVAL